MKRAAFLLLLWAVVLCSASPVRAQEKVDLQMVSRIRYEGFRNSHIKELASGLMDEIGPRLTGSPNMKRANDWTRDQLASFGLANAHLEGWGPFGRGWSQESISVRMISPDVAPLIAYAKAWTPGTNGAVHADCIRGVIESAGDFEKYRGKLAGKIVLLGVDPEVKPIVQSPYLRFSDKSLAEYSEYDIAEAGRPSRRAEYERRERFQDELNKFLAEEKVLATVEHDRETSGGGTVFVSGGGSRNPATPAAVSWLVMAVEQWNRIARILDHGKKVELELNVVNRFYDDASAQYNTVAEIPGGDKKDEIVMVGAHLDSWHAGTGATDNGAGSVVMMEAMRILKALDFTPRRTIRIALWSGEEQGLLGSEHYIEQHFGSRPPLTGPDSWGKTSLRHRDAGPLTVKPEQAKVSAYFNVDNGTGKIRGIYLQENAALAPIFEAWIQPFRDLGMTTLTMNNTTGTDHLSFDAVGIPGFQFIQDPIEYDTRTHHSNMDVYDRLQLDDLKQAAVIVASFVYSTAMRDDMLPRKPIEKPLPKETSAPAR
jgi:hypothetical protein